MMRASVEEEEEVEAEKEVPALIRKKTKRGELFISNQEPETQQSFK